MIRFYGTRGPYALLSNFAATPVRLRGVTYQTVEHAYQAWKTTDRDAQAWVVAAETPAVAKGRGRRVPMRADWDAVKRSVMRVLLTIKARTHPAVSALLAATGDTPLMEASPTDAYWGAGPSGRGMNWLGRLWQEERALQRLRYAPPVMGGDPLAVPVSLALFASGDAPYRAWLNAVLLAGTPNDAQVAVDTLTGLMRVRAPQALALAVPDAHAGVALVLADALVRAASWPTRFGDMPALFPA